LTTGKQYKSPVPAPRFFFNERSQQFPLFTEAIRFFSALVAATLDPLRSWWYVFLQNWVIYPLVN
jgi:hypothetical protein